MAPPQRRTPSVTEPVAPIPASPDDLAAWLADGQRALEAGQLRESAIFFTRASDALPHELALTMMAANAWRLANDTLREREVLQRGFAHAAHHASGSVAKDAESWHALGTALLAAGAPTEAHACFERVVRLRSRDPAALAALAGATRAIGEPRRAWPIMQRALTLAAASPAALLSAAQIRHALGDLTGAREWINRANRARPNHSPTLLQRAFTSLLGGANADGWVDFEHRGLPVHSGAARPWHGEPLTGASIVVLAEQGIGDLFHFARYVSQLATRGAARIIVEVPRSAMTLFAASGFDVVARGDAPDTDWYVPMLSLPHRLGADSDVANSTIPYLRTGAAASGADDTSNSTASHALATRALSHTTRRLGLVWKGNPAFLATTLRDFDESLLPALFDMPNVEWVSLQFGQRAPVTHARLHEPELSAEWLETARLLETLDGVVCVDTGIAHLAGAMGRPVYVMLPFSPDWRWGLNADRTPWYPTARLFRQQAPRDWASVVTQLRQAIFTGS